MQLATDVDIEQWSAVTVSTQLTRLDLESLGKQPLPQLAPAYLFPPGRTLPHLQTLRLSPECADDQEGWCLDGDDLRLIMSACPALKVLHIASVVREDADVSALMQLPHCCTSLRIGGDAFTDATVGLIAQLTSLRELCWLDSWGFSDVGLQQLSMLQSLTSLELSGCAGISSHVWVAATGEDGNEMYLTNGDEVRCACGCVFFYELAC